MFSSTGKKEQPLGLVPFNNQSNVERSKGKDEKTETITFAGSGFAGVLSRSRGSHVGFRQQLWVKSVLLAKMTALCGHGVLTMLLHNFR